MQAHSAKTLPHQDYRAWTRWRHQAFDLIRLRVSGQVRVVRLLPMQQHIPHRSTYHIELFMLRTKRFGQRHNDI